MRLNRYLAEGGLCSRRKADELIRDGRVKVNGVSVVELGSKVDPDQDLVQVNGKAVHAPNRRVVLLLNKPKGVICTMADTHDRRTVMDLVELDLRVVPVGRLDADSTGALLLTNDGELMNALLHPSSHVPKEYIVLTDRDLTPEEMEKLAGGVRMDGSRTKPCEIERIGRTGSRPRYRLVLTEGRNRQIRRMMEGIGVRVERLHRRSLAGLSVEDLEPGQWRVLLGKEVDRLRKAVKQAANEAMFASASATATPVDPYRLVGRSATTPATPARERSPRTVAVPGKAAAKPVTTPSGTRPAPRPRPQDEVPEFEGRYVRGAKPAPGAQAQPPESGSPESRRKGDVYFSKPQARTFDNGKPAAGGKRSERSRPEPKGRSFDSGKPDARDTRSDNARPAPKGRSFDSNKPSGGSSRFDGPKPAPKGRSFDSNKPSGGSPRFDGPKPAPKGRSFDSGKPEARDTRSESARPAPKGRSFDSNKPSGGSSRFDGPKPAPKGRSFDSNKPSGGSSRFDGPKPAPKGRSFDSGKPEARDTRSESARPAPKGRSFDSNKPSGGSSRFDGPKPAPKGRSFDNGKPDARDSRSDSARPAPKGRSFDSNKPSGGSSRFDGPKPAPKGRSFDNGKPDARDTRSDSARPAPKGRSFDSNKPSGGSSRADGPKPAPKGRSAAGGKKGAGTSRAKDARPAPRGKSAPGGKPGGGAKSSKGGKPGFASKPSRGGHSR